MKHVRAEDVADRADELLDRVAASETITITRDGIPFAELRPIPKPRATLTMGEVLERFRQLPPDDPEQFRRDLGAILDPYS